jgi:outer membrane assembly lipoprotein YfiO
MAFMIATFGIIIAGCGPKAPPPQSCDDFYQLGLRYLDDEKWLKAKEMFETITYNFPGCDLVDDAQFMLGEMYYRQSQYIEAQFEYRRVVEDFRLSDRMEDAQYKLALAAYEQSSPTALDQTGTEEAIFRFQQYLDDFPNGKYSEDTRGKVREARKKLSQKEYMTARFYRRMDYDEASLIYLNHILEEFTDTEEWVEHARFLKAQILMDRDQNQEALLLLRAVNQNLIKARFREDVQRLIAQLQEGVQ